MPTVQEIEKKLEEMLKHGVHLGHRSFKWNPKMKPYLYTVKNGIHIIDLRQCLKALEKAKEYLRKTASEGKTILMISTKPQATELVKQAALKCGMPYVIQKWVSGLLTNFSTIKKRINYLKHLQEEEKSGGFEKYTKKEALNLKKTIVKLENALGGVAQMTQLPEAIFIADVVKDKIAVREALKMKITTIGITDTNADPEKINFPIPGNDDAVNSLGFLIREIEEAIIEGKTKTFQEKGPQIKPHIKTNPAEKIGVISIS